MVVACQGHSCVLNTQKALLKIPGFTIVYLLGVYILFSQGVGVFTQVMKLGFSTWYIISPVDQILPISKYVIIILNLSHPCINRAQNLPPSKTNGDIDLQSAHTSLLLQCGTISN